MTRARTSERRALLNLRPAQAKPTVEARADPSLTVD